MFMKPSLFSFAFFFYSPPHSFFLSLELFRAVVEKYLLEKSRLVSQEKDER